jgi:cation:H+ antiporter
VIIWLTLLSGLVLLILGAEVLVKGASRLATFFGVPSLVIGLTIVAFGTSAPELAVSVKAAFDGEAELAIANVIGSNIVNVLVILGISSIILPLAIANQLVRQDLPIMVGLSLVLVLFVQDGQLGKIEQS